MRQDEGRAWTRMAACRQRVQVGLHLNLLAPADICSTNALKQLKALGGDPKGKAVESPVSTSKSRKASVTDCCICLFSVTVCQSLFIA